jgi:predicted transcriptional regulator
MSHRLGVPPWRAALARRLGGRACTHVSNVGECIAIAMHFGVLMKTSTIPSLRVNPELRNAAESVLQEGETLSGFVEQSLRQNIQRRQAQQEFIARGLASAAEAERTGEYFDADDVLRELDVMLDEATRAQK